jgi:non-homologous end joining protein Ku
MTSGKLRPQAAVHISLFSGHRVLKENADRVGIGRVTLSGRERLVMVEPRDAGLVLIIHRAAEEVRAPSFATADTAINADMVAVA